MVSKLDDEDWKRNHATGGISKDDKGREPANGNDGLLDEVISESHRKKAGERIANTKEFRNNRSIVMSMID